MKTRLEISAGGVIYRRSRGRTEVCLIATNAGRTWQLPKGLIERDEPVEETARREVEEETGLHGALEQPLEKIEYSYVWPGENGPERVHKFVTFYLFRYLAGSTDDHDHEVDDARWFPIDEAQQRLSFDGERRVLAIAAEALSDAGAPRRQSRRTRADPSPT